MQQQFKWTVAVTTVLAVSAAAFALLGDGSVKLEARPNAAAPPPAALLSPTPRTMHSAKPEASAKTTISSAEQPVASATTAPTVEDPSMIVKLDELVMDDAMNSGYAFNLLSTNFEGLADALAEESRADASALELRSLYADQIAAMLADTDVRLQRLECGAGLCAAEVARPLSSQNPDPFGNDRVNAWLPHEAKMQLSFAAGDTAIRRLLFSTDPQVRSLSSRGARR